MKIPARHQTLIDKLIERGFGAYFRRWSLSDTVCVATGAHELAIGLIAYEQGLYVLPSGDNDWQIDIGPSDPTAILDAEIVARVELLLTSPDVYDQKSRQLAREAYERSKKVKQLE